MIGLAWALAFQLGQRVWPTIEMDKLSPLLPYFAISPSGSEVCLLTLNLGWPWPWSEYEVV